MVSRGSEVDVEYSKQKIINKFNTFVVMRLLAQLRLRYSKKIQKKLILQISM